jgi:ABC-type molybdate transport system permease subunit
MTIVALTPLLCGIEGVRTSFKYCLIAAVISISIGIPCAMLLEGERIHFNSLTNQFAWAGVFNVLPGVLFSAVIKLYALVIAGKR